MSVDWTNWPSDPIWLDSGFWDWRPPWVRPMRPGTMRWALFQTQAPAIEPVDLATVKNHIRVDYDDDDALIQNLITSARDFIERDAGLSLVTQTWQLYLDRFPRANAYETWPWSAPPATILLPRYPVQSVASVVWKDANGGTNTVDPSTYLVDLQSRFPRLVPKSTGQGWPAESGPPLVQQNGVVVTFTSGYASQGVLPPTLRAALLLLVGHWYQNRETVVTDTRVAAIELPYTFKVLMAQHRPAMVG